MAYENIRAIRGIRKHTELTEATKNLLKEVAKSHPQFALDNPKDKSLYLAYHKVRELIYPELYNT